MAHSAETTLAWPTSLAQDDEGRVQGRFPDFPEALTDGADEAEALAEAADCLAEAVAARIADGEELPAPSPLRRGMYAVPLPPVLAYKAALFSAMRRDAVSKSELARRLDIDEKDVRRLLDPRYRGSKVERLHAALAACGVAAQITLVDTGRHERLLGAATGPGRDTRKPAPAVATRRAGSGIRDTVQLADPGTVAEVPIDVLRLLVCCARSQSRPDLPAGDLRANGGKRMKQTYTAAIRQSGPWWIGWIEEVPGVNCQERTKEELLETLRITLREALAR